MHPVLEEAQESLDQLATALNTLGKDKRPFNQIWGWNCLALTIKDLADMASDLSKFIGKYGVEVLDLDLADRIELIPSRIESFRNHTMSQIWGGNNSMAATTYMALVEWIKVTLAPLSSWEVIQDSKALPTQLNRRLRSIQADIDEIVPKTEGLQDQMRLIREASDAAESLPVDLQSLKEARANMLKVSEDSAVLYSMIHKHATDSSSHATTMESLHEQAQSLVQQSAEAYRITTSTGLAGAFHDRANKLYRNLGLWVVGLLAALGVGGMIGAARFDAMSSFLRLAAEGKGMHWGLIWMEFVLSVIGLAAPIWFAWLATRQIHQCFMLAEDYSYKASVAKAYEGYRREAARIDPELEARLFGSALTRLEEAPLRLVDNEMHASPMQEFLNSPTLHQAIAAFPALKTEVSALAKHGLNTVAALKPNGKATKAIEESE